jgi:hypothetical protein
MARFARATPRLTAGRTTVVLHASKMAWAADFSAAELRHNALKSGGPDGTRTHLPLVDNEAIRLLHLQARNWLPRLVMLQHPSLQRRVCYYYITRQ